MSDDIFPEELWIEILSRLPVKSLVPFTLVSKSWHSLITSPSFISAHLRYAKNRNLKTQPSILLRRYSAADKMERYSLHTDDGSEIGIEAFKSSCKGIGSILDSQIGYPRIVGSCDGLLCLSFDLFSRSEAIMLWNPSIQKSITLPLPNVKPPSVRPYWFALGFGSPQGSQDFKVVRILNVLNDHEICGQFMPHEVEVYSLRTRAWRRLICLDVKWDIVDFMWSQVYVNGATHWIAYDPKFLQGGNDSTSDASFRSLVLAFDMADEVFRDIMLPANLAMEIASNLFLTKIDESVAVIKYYNSMGLARFDIWVMKEYGVVESWTQLYNINLGLQMVKVVGVRKNGQILMSTRDNSLVSYDPRSAEVLHLDIYGSPRAFSVDNYRESLILLDWQLSFGQDAGSGRPV